MPLSTFDGQPTIEVHQHYSPDDKLTGTTVVTRPGWSDTDRAYALGLAAREAGECRRCGGDLNETLDDRWKWMPLPPVVCHRCVGMRHSEHQQKDHPYHASMIHQVAKVPNPLWVPPQEPSEVDDAL